MVPVRLVLVLVDAHHHSRVRVLPRRRQQHLDRTALQMQRGGVPLPETPRRFDDDVRARLPPVQAGRIPLRGHGYPPPVDEQRARLRPDRPTEPAVRRVVLQQMGQSRRRRDVVDRHHLHRCPPSLRPLQNTTEIVPSDPPEPVDRYPYHHAVPPSSWLHYRHVHAPPAPRGPFAARGPPSRVAARRGGGRTALVATGRVNGTTPAAGGRLTPTGRQTLGTMRTARYRKEEKCRKAGEPAMHHWPSPFR